MPADMFLQAFEPAGFPIKFAIALVTVPKLL
jgi:hypothetical protein